MTESDVIAQDDDEDERDERDDVPRSPFPDQPIELVGDVVRFKANRVVEHWQALAEKAGYTLNHLAVDRCNGKFTQAECASAMQQLGYSVSGWGDLSFVSYEDAGRNDEAAAELCKDPVTKLGDVARA